jgi:hypothetical protein
VNTRYNIGTLSTLLMKYDVLNLKGKLDIEGNALNYYFEAKAIKQGIADCTSVSQVKRLVARELGQSPDELVSEILN